ncbi:MAG: ABC transporter ATP-binding protein [Gammaproteobacteria bacterium]|nr:ABC transporter ATP-binding protein [Gammaproteobacteria bacterium]NNF67261.1 ABC transporter ATP-binding protein [Gammaproteobacteria bacterium]
MNTIVTARGLTKRYGENRALDNVDFNIEAGRIVGLIGPNGAGKTTALSAMLGLTRFEGQLEVLGCDPYRERARLMRDVCFIADVAILPKWLRVRQALDFVAGVHPRFSRQRAESFLAKTQISPQQKIRTLSKGMVTQLHLAIVMAIDVKLLVLDEPTLGLDILFRKQFYETVLGDYFDDQKTIVVTTHQVEEVENILTDLIFINNGHIVLDESMDDVADKYVELLATPDKTEAARAIGAIHERDVLGKRLFLYEGVSRQRLSALGEIHRPSVADLFVAKMQGVAA